MTKLQDFLGGLLGQIANGRSQADLATLEVAKLYREHPSELLKEFPVPRLTLDEVVLDLRLAVAAAPEQEPRLDSEARQEVIAKIMQFARGLPEEDEAIREVAEKAPKLRRVWKAADPQLESRLARFIPEGRSVDPEFLGQGAASLVRAHVAGLIADEGSGIEQPLASELVSRRLPQLEERWSERLQGLVAESAPPAAQEGIEVLVTAAELQSVPVEKVTSMRLTLRESDRSWTEYETEPGTTVSKLVPS